MMANNPIPGSGGANDSPSDTPLLQSILDNLREAEVKIRQFGTPDVNRNREVGELRSELERLRLLQNDLEFQLRERGADLEKASERLASEEKHNARLREELAGLRKHAQGAVSSSAARDARVAELTNRIAELEEQLFKQSQDAARQVNQPELARLRTQIRELEQDREETRGRYDAAIQSLEKENDELRKARPASLAQTAARVSADTDAVPPWLAEALARTLSPIAPLNGKPLQPVVLRVFDAFGRMRQALLPADVLVTGHVQKLMVQRRLPEDLKVYVDMYTSPIRLLPTALREAIFDSGKSERLATRLELYRKWQTALLNSAEAVLNQTALIRAVQEHLASRWGGKKIADFEKENGPELFVRKLDQQRGAKIEEEFQGEHQED